MANFLTQSAEESIQETKRQKEKFDMYMWYVLIGLISIISLTFLPMMSSDWSIATSLPKTFLGWCIYIFTKIIIAVLNILLFHCFIQQGDTNVKYYYKRRIADELLAILKLSNYDPLSPEAWKRREYKHKGTTIVITSILSVFCLSQAILSFDLTTFLSYLFTIFLGLIFGVLQMKKTEIYYSGEYYDYAIKRMNIYNETANEDEILSVVLNATTRRIYKGSELIYDYYLEFPKEKPE